MSLDQLGMILADMYLMDAWIPPLRMKWKADFEKESYSEWAVNELKDYIAEKIYPRTNGSVNEFCSITQEFMTKMDRYSKTNRKTRIIFQIARDRAANILDLLHAMQ